MERSPEISTFARAIRDMHTRMLKNEASGPAKQIVADMGRLSEAMTSLDTIASDRSDEISREQRQARTQKVATRLSEALPGVSERLQKLETEAGKGFDSAFLEHSGLAHTANAAEIRSYLINSKTLAERQAFLQEALKGNDNETLSAVLLAPAYLSGFPVQRHLDLKAQIEELRLPLLAANRRMFSELTVNLKTAIDTAQEACRSFADPHKLRLHEAQAQAVKAAEAQLAGGL